jgi:hypothetical protein
MYARTDGRDRIASQNACTRSGIGTSSSRTRDSVSARSALRDQPPDDVDKLGCLAHGGGRQRLHARRIDRRPPRPLEAKLAKIEAYPRHDLTSAGAAARIGGEQPVLGEHVLEVVHDRHRLGQHEVTVLQGGHARDRGLARESRGQALTVAEQRACERERQLLLGQRDEAGRIERAREVAVDEQRELSAHSRSVTPINWRAAASRLISVVPAPSSRSFESRASFSIPTSSM